MATKCHGSIDSFSSVHIHPLFLLSPTYVWCLLPTHPMHTQSSPAVTPLVSHWPILVSARLYRVMLHVGLRGKGMSSSLTKLYIYAVLYCARILAVKCIPDHLVVSNLVSSSFNVNRVSHDAHAHCWPHFLSLTKFLSFSGTLTITPAPPSLSSAPPWRTTLTEVDPLCWMSQCSHCRQSGTLPEQPSWGLLSAVHRTCTGTCSSTTSEQMFTEHSFVQWKQ